MAKGHKTGGRRTGTPNKTTSEVKALVLAALDELGGVQYLVERARDPKTAPAFLSLVGRVLPLQVAHSGELTISERLARAQARLADVRDPTAAARRNA